MVNGTGRYPRQRLPETANLELASSVFFSGFLQVLPNVGVWHSLGAGRQMTPLGRSLVWLRRQWCIAGVVERWLMRCNRRREAFGFGDILAASARDGVVLLGQATSDAHVA